MKRIDLNCDLGEFPKLVEDGTDDRILQFITSANIACGGHAGDDATMQATVSAALRHGVGVGAHPSYPDREGFGRRQLDLSPDEIEEFVERQIRALDDVARRLGTFVVHVKPHGALYHAAGTDPSVARAIARGSARVRDGFLLVGQSGSSALAVWKEMGLPTAGEGFADRTYEPDGKLRPRSLEDALLTDPDEAATQALRIAGDGVVITSSGMPLALKAETLCIHGDTPGAARIAQAVHARLEAAGVRLQRPSAGQSGLHLRTDRT